MLECFVIMPIGAQETEFMWNQVYQPILRECDFRAIRIDEEDNGTLIPAQIIQQINSSVLIVADLTLARPNCYFEVGYAMGINRYNSLILCCREDHNIHSPKSKGCEHKLHFDLQSYGVLWWNKDDVDKFKQDLRLKVSKRKPKLKPVEEASGLLETTLEERLQAFTKSEEMEAAKWIKQN